jgi:amidase
MDELITSSAAKIVAMLQSGEIEIGDTLAALEARIAEVDGDINALPTLCFERAREAAAQQGFSTSLLGGIPVAIKDLTDVAGVRTTYGSMLSENHVPRQSDLLVETIERNGGIVYAKSNTPEFGSGANTFNDVFGATRNPYDLSLSVGGSSGGAAAALASGCAWLAQGSDLGGSLRTPASFCGVTSLRPSPGLIPTSPGQQPFGAYSQTGPMARNVTDLALFADAMAGCSSLAGLGKPHQPTELQDAAAQPRKPLRVAFSIDLGIADTSTEVAAVCGAAITGLGRENIDIETAHPDLSMAHRAFDVPRALDYALSYGPELERIRSVIKPENAWNIEFGLHCPAAIVPPYPVEERYPGFSEGLAYSEYYRWLAIVYAITTTTLPVISIPCGKTDAGLPVGLQLIGKAHGERELFGYASYLEQVFDWDPLQAIRAG